jgi:hypothetical protein
MSRTSVAIPTATPIRERSAGSTQWWLREGGRRPKIDHPDAAQNCLGDHGLVLSVTVSDSDAPVVGDFTVGRRPARGLEVTGQPIPLACCGAAVFCADDLEIDA